MKTLYLDCGLGVSEQALYKALLELHPNPGDFEIRLHSAFDTPDIVRQNAATIYSLLGQPDAATRRYVLGICLLIHELGPERIISSPINVGWGKDFYANKLLQGIPVFTTEDRNVHCTTAGAALLTHFAYDFNSMPVMVVEAVGYGKDKDSSVRAIIGEVQNNRDYILELCCNVDDMTGEALGFAMERLYEAGAIDVYFTNINMKKNRPGVMLTCMGREKDREGLLQCLFRHTTTLGVREYRCSRYNLTRSIRTEKTAHGTVLVKTASGYGVTREKAEYEDVARIAREQNISLAEVLSEVRCVHER